MPSLDAKATADLAPAQRGLLRMVSATFREILRSHCHRPAHGAVASDRAAWSSDDGELTQILPVDQRPDRHRVVSLAVVRGSPV
jgi:hypothetical protein